MTEITQTIFDFNTGRKKPILKLKYESMCENAFRFFRGSCHLFYERLSKADTTFTSPVAWICGDLHLENFGSFRGDNQLTYFDLNDFDEAIKAPVLWEVARVVSSILIAFQVLEIDADQGINMALLFMRTYRNTLISGKPVAIEPRTARGIVGDFLKQASRSSAAALLRKRTYKHKHHLYLNLKDERHFALSSHLKMALKDHMKAFLKQSSTTPYNYRVRDIVYRLAGTGSLGQRRYLFLLQNKKDRNQHLLLDMKEALPSSLAFYVNQTQPEWPDQAQRIVNIQRRMQQVSGAMLDYTRFKDRDYVIQELQPVKDTLKFKMIRDDYRSLIQVIDDMAVLTASSQLRSAGTYGSATIDELMKFGKESNWEDQMLHYATDACEQTFRDYYAFRADVIK